MINLIAALVFFLQPAPPPFTATWQRPGVARLSWAQPAGVHETCVIRNTTLIGCWYDLPSGATGLTLGDSGPIDAEFQTTGGRCVSLAQDGAARWAELRGVVYVAAGRKIGQQKAPVVLNLRTTGASLVSLSPISLSPFLRLDRVPVRRSLEPAA
jgi:hypothetical protein